MPYNSNCTLQIMHSKGLQFHNLQLMEAMHKQTEARNLNQLKHIQVIKHIRRFMIQNQNQGEEIKESTKGRTASTLDRSAKQLQWNACGGRTEEKKNP